MKQPELGLKIAELRLAKNMTQEQLAEACEVSTRTIQRIESGEVDPRTFTLSMLRTILEFDFGEDKNQHDNLWLALLHLSSWTPFVLTPLIIWSWKKRESMRIREEGPAVLNFQITMLLFLFAGALITMIVPLVLFLDIRVVEALKGYSVLLASLTPLPMIAVGFFCTIEAVLNAIRSVAEKKVHYPLSIPFVKQ